jgi:hypothetical protein
MINIHINSHVPDPNYSSVFSEIPRATSGLDNFSSNMLLYITY